MKLKDIRKAAGYTQQKLADKMGVSRSAVAMWESGATDCGLEMATRLAALFGVSVDALLGEQNDAKNTDENELWEYREALRRDPERRILFSLAKDADIQEVRQAVAIIDALKKSGGSDDPA